MHFVSEAPPSSPKGRGKKGDKKRRVMNKSIYNVAYGFVLINPFRLLLIVWMLLPFGVFAQFSVTPTLTNATCPNDTNGAVSLSVAGGSGPLTFLWSPGGEATSSVTGLTPGNYAVTISDSAGNDTTLSLFIGPLPFQNDTAGKITYPFCSANGAIMTEISGANGGYQYTWSTGSTNFWISQLAAGDYSLLVTDSKSCTVTYNYTLSEIECFVDPDPYFTPNGDGFNDSWFIANSQYFPNAHLIIFDRWGLKVYDHKGTYESWDGKGNLGLALPDAAYYYFFYQDKDDKQKASKQGSVIILR